VASLGSRATHSFGGLTSRRQPISVLWMLGPADEAAWFCRSPTLVFATCDWVKKLVRISIIHLGPAAERNL
jgi:hypothetical protein